MTLCKLKKHLHKKANKCLQEMTKIQALLPKAKTVEQAEELLEHYDAETKLYHSYASKIGLANRIFGDNNGNDSN